MSHSVAFQNGSILNFSILITDSDVKKKQSNFLLRVATAIESCFLFLCWMPLEGNRLYGIKTKLHSFVSSTLTKTKCSVFFIYYTVIDLKFNIFSEGGLYLIFFLCILLSIARSGLGLHLVWCPLLRRFVTVFNAFHLFFHIVEYWSSNYLDFFPLFDRNSHFSSI